MIEKTALGAEKNVAWEKWENLEELLEKLSQLSGEGKCEIVALEKINGAIELKKFQPVFPMALVLGNEVEGVSEKILQQCSKVVFLSMRGKKESLNVSVAAGIAMYEILK